MSIRCNRYAPLSSRHNLGRRAFRALSATISIVLRVHPRKFEISLLHQQNKSTMSSTVSFSHFSRCLFTIGTSSMYTHRSALTCILARPAKVVLNKKARIPAYLLSLELSPELLEEHKSLFKKDVYSSSAQITNQHTIEDLEGAQIL